jgi:hypothetical protein
MPTTPVVPGGAVSPVRGFSVSRSLVRFGLARTAPVSLCVSDIRGRVVCVYSAASCAAGYHELRLPAESMSKGGFVMSFKAGSFHKTAVIGPLQ